jgi:two-component system, OmpR family, sensor kinase
MSSSLRAERLDPDLVVEPGDDPEAAETPAAQPRPRWLTPSAWTLRSKLVVSMVVLFAVITLLTGTVTALALRGFLYQQLDDQLLTSLRGPSTISLGNGCDARGNRGPGEGLVAFATLDQATVNGCASDRDNQRAPLTQAQLTTIFEAGLARPTTIDLGGSLGSFRLVAAQGTASGPGVQIPGTKVVGLSTQYVDQTVSRVVVIVVGTVLGGLLLVALGCTWLVRRTLRPLDRVAATATRVSHLPLSAGKVDLVERVPAEDTDTNTEVGQVGAAFNEMLDHIDNALNARQKSEERVRQFVADASHELRTPLASIRGYAELTRREQESVPPRVTHAIGRVESEAMRMTALVDDLLLLARLDAGRPLDHETVDLTEMVVNAVSDAHAASPDHVWQLDLPDDPVVIQGDPARLHQIVANLLGNARTHTAPGTVVRTSIVREPHRARITVRDNGPGIPKELQADVFQRFARGDTSRNRAAGSTGLGLSIVAAVAQAHGGSVSLDSVPGDTTFTVILPA